MGSEQVAAETGSDQFFHTSQPPHLRGRSAKEERDQDKGQTWALIQSLKIMTQLGKKYLEKPKSVPSDEEDKKERGKRGGKGQEG